ncbi:MAG: geranylgeranyl reductase family protein [Bradymonadia bacterium]
MKWDVIIIGGGPSGSAAAISLAQHGVKVVLLEQRRTPRPKVCGDALLPDAIHALKTLNLLPKIHQHAYAIPYIRLSSPRGFQTSLELPVLSLARQDLDEVLLHHAQSLGVEVLDQTRAVGFDNRGRASVIVEGEMGCETLHAPIALLCTGASTKALKCFGVPHRSSASAYAARTYGVVKGLAENTLHVWYDRTLQPGYGWAFPMGGGLFNIGIGAFADTSGNFPFNLREIWDHFVGAKSARPSALRSVQWQGALKGAPLRTSLKGTALARDHLLIAGEAIGTTQALTGEGIGKALECGRYAAQVALNALDSGQLSRVALSSGMQRKIAQLTPIYRGYDRLQQLVSHGWLTDALTLAARSHSGFRRALEDMLTERQTPSETISIRGALSYLPPSFSSRR